MWTREKLIRAYLDFFKERGHAVIPSASLIPEHDPTVLFTTAGMHPLVPFLLGQPHPLGKRLTNVQKCIRTGDIESVGDSFHLTFFEMLGNWSLGDYFKKEAITWSYEFLTQVLGFDVNKLYVTVFAGDEDAPRDEESARIWQSLGIKKERIYFLPKSDNWWGPVGSTGPCGPCTEMFIDTGKHKCSPECRPGCGCGKYFEIWNDVFMEYNKLPSGKYEKLKQKNVDTGMGVERTLALLQGKESVYDTELFLPIIDGIKKLARVNEFTHEQLRSVRIIADHIKAATFILGDERAIVPSNVDQGYVLRRLIRRAMRHGHLLNIKDDLCRPLAKIVIELYGKSYEGCPGYPELEKNKAFIMEQLIKEEQKFRQTLEQGIRQFNKLALAAKSKAKLSGKETFLLFQSYGFPFEMTRELAREKGIEVSEAEFREEFRRHQEISRAGAEQRFKGGLSEASEITAKLHTATHLLNEALRRVLKNPDIRQRGSNITPERLRFDFNFPRKLTTDEIKAIEEEVNKRIAENLEVWKEEMSVEQAKAIGAQAEFQAKYPERVWVYFIGNRADPGKAYEKVYSKEICMGPHASSTGELGKFKIISEESVAAGIRRIKAVLE
ncbi:MAG: alanine--tRNA ligase [Candidatus Pacearchaeota archaeon]